MSCASPISQLSPPSLRMYSTNNNLLSPCRSNGDDPPFSFAFHNAPQLPSSSSSSPASSPAKSRPVLTDILLPRHKNSPRSQLNRVSTLLSPRRCAKENWENTEGVQLSNACAASIDPLYSLTGKVKKRDVENDPSYSHAAKAKRSDVENGTNCIHPLCSCPNPRQAVGANYMQLASPRACGREDDDKTLKAQRHDEENGVSICSSPSPSSLKRKRPAKLAIPEFARLASFGKVKQFELPAHEPLSSEILSSEGPLFGVSCRKGRRDCMEDAHAAITNFQGNPNQAFFGVFDGHGGKIAAQFAAEHLGHHIEEAIQNHKSDKESLESAMQAGYLAIDSEFSKKGLDSGACSVSAYVKEGQLVVANAGDCKAVLCREGKAEALSSIHRASNAKERQRIESLGGYVDCFNGVWRVQGTLAVTRAFGDTNLKKWISAEPEVQQRDITKGCEFLILASDGLWDKVSDQEAVDCVREVLRQGEEEESEDFCTSRPSKVLRKVNDTSVATSGNIKKSESTSSSMKIDACNKLIHKACNKGNLDDITVMVVPLANFCLPHV